MDLSKHLKFLMIIPIIISIILLMEKSLTGLMLSVMVLFGINAIVCLGVSITNSYTNIFSLGFGGIMLVAAYTSALLTLPVTYKTAVLHLPSWLESSNWAFGPAIIVSGAVAVLASVILVLPAFRLRGHYFILASLGINIVMANLGINLSKFTHGAMGIRNIPFYTNLWWVFGFLALTVIFIWRLIRSKYGRALITIGKDNTLAATLGIPVVRYKIYSFIIGSFIVGIGGALWVHYIGAMHPHVFDLVFVFMIVAMLAIGGSNTISGAITGAAIITFFTQLARPIQEGFTLAGVTVPSLQGLIQVLIAIMLVLVIIYRPDGIFYREPKINWLFGRAKDRNKPR